jgi:hypothetical protein
MDSRTCLRAWSDRRVSGSAHFEATAVGWEEADTRRVGADTHLAAHPDIYRQICLARLLLLKPMTPAVVG